MLASCELHVVSKSAYVKDRTGMSLACFVKATYVRFKDVFAWREHLQTRKSQRKRVVTLFDASIPMTDTDLDAVVRHGEAVFVEHLNSGDGAMVIPDLRCYIQRNISVCLQKDTHFLSDTLTRFVLLKVCCGDHSSASFAHFFPSKSPLCVWHPGDVDKEKPLQDFLSRYDLSAAVGRCLLDFVQSVDKLVAHKMLLPREIEVYADGLHLALRTRHDLKSKSTKSILNIMDQLAESPPSCRLLVNRVGSGGLEMVAILETSPHALCENQNLEVFLLHS